MNFKRLIDLEGLQGSNFLHSIFYFFLNLLIT